MPLMQSIRKNAKFVLLFMAFAFILWIFLELGMNIAGVQITKPYQRGIIAEIDGIPANIDQYQNILNELLEKEREEKGDLTDKEIFDIEKRAWKELIFRMRFLKIQRERNLIIDDNLLNTIIMTAPPPQVLNDSSFWKGDSFDVQKYREFLNNPASREIVLAYARDIVNSYPIELMNLDISFVFHVPQDELQKELEMRLTKFTFDFYNILFYKIPNEIFKVNDDSLKIFYEKNKEKFKKEESFKVGYVFLKIRPSKNDTETIIEDLKEIKDIIQNEGLKFEEAILTYSTIKKYKKDTIFKADKQSKKFEFLKKFKKGSITEPFISGDTAFLFKVVSITKNSISYKAIAMLLNTSYDTRASLREKVKNIFEIAKTEGLKKAAESYGFKFNESGNVPVSFSFIPGIGRHENILNWVKKAKKGDVNYFWVPGGFYIVEVLEKSPESYFSFNEIKERVKALYLKEKKKEFAKKIADDIINGKGYEKLYVVKKEFKEVSFMNPLAGIANPDQVLGALYSMEPGERRKLEFSTGVVVLELKEKIPPSPEEISANINSFYQRYLGILQRKVFEGFQSELRSEKGVKDYRSILLE